MDLSDRRIEYARDKLDREDLLSNPVTQFEKWLKQAEECALDEPNAMCLATVDADGRPTTRVVLLKQFDERGLVFFTNYESRKSADITANPKVAANFLWLPLQRQVNIRGTAERISTAESLRYFVTRPLHSRLGAWTSPQSKVISSRQLLEAKWEEMKRRFHDGDVPLPSFWGGYRIVPESFEFWQGRPGRLHDRFLYQRSAADDTTWSLERLAP